MFLGPDRFLVDQPFVRETPTLMVSTVQRDSRTVVLDCSREFLERLGYARDDVVGEPLATFTNGEGSQDGDGRSGPFLGETILVGDDGEPVRTIGVAVSKEDGGTERYYAPVEEGDRRGSNDDARLLDAVLAIDNAVSREDVYELTAHAAADVLGGDCFMYRSTAGRLELVAESDGPRDSPDPTAALGIGPLGRAYGAGVRRRTDDPDELATLGLDPDVTEAVVCFPVEEYGALVATTAQDDLDPFERIERLLELAGSKLDRFELFDDLTETKGRLLRLLSNVPGTVYECADSPAREMSFVTDDIEGLTGYDRQEFLDGRLSWEADLVHSGDRDQVFSSVTEAVRSREPYRMTYRIVTKSGQERWVWDHGGGVYEDGEVVGLQGFITDVTERERHKQRLEVLNRVLRHNLRNNMNVIMGYAETLLNEIGGDAPRMHANYIMEEARELTELGDKARTIEQALDFEKNAPDAIEVNETVETKVEEFRGRYPDADLRLELPDVEVTGPPAVDYALENVLENAIVHNDRESPTVEVFVYVVEGTHNDWTEVVVADDGPGIPDHEVRALLEGGETPLQHGSGLGLWLVNWLVKRSGGELQFDENEPRGSIVTMRLPR